MSAPAPDLEAAVDRLYERPPGEFTEARNALAAERRAAGDREGAAHLKALVRPTAVAWAVNLVYWKHRELFDALGTAIAQVASAQREALRGEGACELRDAARRKGDALQLVLRVAERRLLDAGLQAGPQVLQRVAATFEAAASPRPAGDPGPRVGRLVVELQPAGFDVALGLGALDLPPVREDAQRALQQARLELARLRHEAETAERLLGEAEARAEAARADVDQLAARLRETRSRAEEKAAAANEARQALEAARASPRPPPTSKP